MKFDFEYHRPPGTLFFEFRLKLLQCGENHVEIAQAILDAFHACLAGSSCGM